MLEEKTTGGKKNIGNDLGGERTRTRNWEAKDRRVGWRRWNG